MGIVVPVVVGLVVYVLAVIVIIRLVTRRLAVSKDETREPPPMAPMF